MTRPRFSIVVPTRERPALLRACLASCVAQRSSDVEIIVADNASGPETRAVCESFHDERIRWLRCPEPLSMNDNWSRALDSAQGEWVMFIGDDDALMPYAIEELARLVGRYDVEAIRWQSAVYTWPCLTIPSQADRLQFIRCRETRIRDWDEAVGAMLTQGAPSVPMIYYGLIHRSLIDRARRTGPVFEGLCPDYFSGVLFAFLAARFLDTNVPMTIAGLSGRSNGVANMRVEDGRRSAVAREFAELNRRAGMQCHPDLPPYYVNHRSLAALDPLFRARDRCFPGDPRFMLTPARITALYLAALSPNPAVREEQLAMLRQFLARRSPEEDFDSLVATHGGTAPPPKFVLGGGPVGRRGWWEIVDAEAHGVRDVYAASLLAARLLDYAPGRIHYRFRVGKPGIFGKLRRSLAKRIMWLAG
jgi:glycosyltransferase involved in cell wall biosynthesis